MFSTANDHLLDIDSSTEFSITTEHNLNTAQHKTISSITKLSLPRNTSAYKDSLGTRTAWRCGNRIPMLTPSRSRQKSIAGRADFSVQAQFRGQVGHLICWCMRTNAIKSLLKFIAAERIYLGETWRKDDHLGFFARSDPAVVTGIANKCGSIDRILTTLACRR